MWNSRGSRHTLRENTSTHKIQNSVGSGHWYVWNVLINFCDCPVVVYEVVLGDLPPVVQVFVWWWWWFGKHHNRVVALREVAHEFN